MSDDPLTLRPFLVHDGQVTYGPDLATEMHEFVGFLLDQKTRSLIVMLYDQAIMDPSRACHAVPAVLVGEKDVFRMIGALREALAHLQQLPVEEKEEHGDSTDSRDL